MNLDLSRARTLAESWLIDRCVVRRDPQGTTDDAVDPVTLALVPPDPDASTVYQGPCLLGKAAQRASRDDEGQQSVHRRVVRLRFPVSAARFRTGDTVVVEASDDARSNAQLVGQRFRVFDVDDRSLSASRTVLAEDDTGARPR